MGFLISISFLVLMSLSLMCCSQAREYYVGGNEGWVVKPKESFNHWAERERFKVNDTLGIILQYFHLSYACVCARARI